MLAPERQLKVDALAQRLGFGLARDRRRVGLDRVEATAPRRYWLRGPVGLSRAATDLDRDSDA